jgi:hypothetical protein
MLNSSPRFSLPPVALAVPEKAEDALTQCAQGESPPEIALMQFLVMSPSESAAQRELGTAIWDALEKRESPMIERLGAMHQLWEGARRMVRAALP